MMIGLLRSVGPAFCSLLILLFVAAASADDLDSIIFEGVIQRQIGAVIPAAEVVVIHTATGVERACDKRHEGRFRIAVGTPGNYILKASANGFTQQESQEIAVTTGRAFSIDLTLAAAGVSEQITVAAASPPLVDTNRTVVGDTITQRELDDLPVINRDPLQLVFLLGGVTEAPFINLGIGGRRPRRHSSRDARGGWFVLAYRRAGDL